MRDYIIDKVKHTTRHFKFGNVPVDERRPLPDSINLEAILKTIEKHFPAHYFDQLKGIVIDHPQSFDDRDVNAMYRNGTFFISNKQDNTSDLMDDIVHEFAHHMEILYPENIYSDQQLIQEFLKKRSQLKFELTSEGYWTNEYDFKNLKFDPVFDEFLYKRVGRTMLKMATTGLFVRPYASVSLREYFATGFEAYYMGKRDSLKKISPVLYNKVHQLHNLNH
jgi:hypothetical protein